MEKTIKQRMENGKIIEFKFVAFMKMDGTKTTKKPAKGDLVGAEVDMGHNGIGFVPRVEITNLQDFD